MLDRDLNSDKPDPEFMNMALFSLMDGLEIMEKEIDAMAIHSESLKKKL